MIPHTGGESTQLTDAPEGILAFRWHPSGSRLGYIAQEPKRPRQKALEDKGYGFVYYEENLRNCNLYMVDISEGTKLSASQITKETNVWSFEFSPDGKTAAVATSPRNLIDQSYLFQQIFLLDLGSRVMTRLVNPDAKLGNFAFSPDGSSLAFAAGKSKSDHAVSQAFVIPSRGGAPTNLTPGEFRGHISWVGWRDKATLLYRAGEGAQTSLTAVHPDGSDREILLTSGTTGVVFGTVSVAGDLRRAAFAGQTPSTPGDLYVWSPADGLIRGTTVNPSLSTNTLGVQQVIRYSARDGLEIEGLLLLPVGYEKGKKYPLIVAVHGGPESHYSNGWLTSYGEPGQVLAGRGYTVFYPNYRASTGYGVEFAAQGLGDPAGKEFDDIADGIEYLAGEGIADRSRVGLGGGSYGGYAAAWFATYYTKYVRAVVMFVGISDIVSKQGTTDIPYEDLFVHMGKKLEDSWELSLKRSPVYWARQSTTATLICGGADDTRVHPSQSMELYRRMKMNDHPAVRLVQYPGEQHGNTRQPGRADLLFRTLDWYDWYVRDGKPLSGPMPPLDISERYGLQLPE
jgi:dipeptidyl aminopeptidase/acylaminoacyl peptidase